MDSERINRVTIKLAGGTTFLLPFASRDPLLDEMKSVESLEPVVLRFHAVGASSPVELTLVQEETLIQVIETWGKQLRSESDFPAGVWDLRHALRDDIDSLTG